MMVLYPSHSIMTASFSTKQAYLQAFKLYLPSTTMRDQLIKRIFNDGCFLKRCEDTKTPIRVLRGTRYVSPDALFAVFAGILLTLQSILDNKSNKSSNPSKEQPYGEMKSDLPGILRIINAVQNKEEKKEKIATPRPIMYFPVHYEGHYKHHFLF